MFSVINKLDTYMLSVPLFIYLMIAGKRVGILVFCEDRRHLLGRVRRLRRALGYSGVLGFLRIIVFATIWIDNGWLLVRRWFGKRKGGKTMLIYAIAALLVLGMGAFSLQAITAHIRKEADAKRYWLLAAACFAALTVGFLIIRFF